MLRVCCFVLSFIVWSCSSGCCLWLEFVSWVKVSFVWAFLEFGLLFDWFACFAVFVDFAFVGLFG